MKRTADGQPRELERVSTAVYDDVAANRQRELRPLNSFVNPMLTDMYQVTMAYAYWKHGRHEQHAVFDLYFRRNPFKGEFTVFAGLSECMRFLSSFRFSERDIEFLQGAMGDCDPAFFAWLAKLDCSRVDMYALEEGSVCFPLVPLIRIEGPIAVCQLLETPLLCLVNYASLVATNAARHRLAAGPDKGLLEFGTRRAQGPDGAISASRYSYMGGFDGTSNVAASKFFGLVPKGTHAHSYITSFVKADAAKFEAQGTVRRAGEGGEEVLFYPLARQCLEELGYSGTNPTELIAFASYAIAYPKTTLCLVDTYSTLQSGVPNFLAVALALHRLGYRALGIRLDSGDLAYLSTEARAMFAKAAEQVGAPYFAKFSIVASNDLNESTILALKQQGHEIDVFGIGTNLVTCQAQPALGCVYKLVEVDGEPRIKLSQETSKITLPGRKQAFRLYTAAGNPVVDLLVHREDAPPKAGARILCLHPFVQSKRAYVTPAVVDELHKLFFSKGEMTRAIPTLLESRERVQQQLRGMREDHLRPLNPTPFKVSVTERLHKFAHKIWMSEMPIADLS